MPRFAPRGVLGGWLIIVPIALAAAYLLVVPLFRPHGIYFGWRYRLPDLYLGVPLMVAAIGMVIVRCTSPAKRRARALRLTAAYLAVFITVFGLDFAYALIGTTVLGFPHYDVYTYGSGIKSVDNLRDAELGFVRKPGLDWTGAPAPGLPVTRYRTDENGFRNPSGVSQADVTVVGDSFIEGGAVTEEDTAVQQISRATGLRTINLGRTHYGPPAYAIVTKRYALTYRPRAVVFTVFEGNDLIDADAFVRWQENPEGRQSPLQRFASRSLIVQLLPRTPITTRWRRPFRSSDGVSGLVDVDYTYYPDAPTRWPRGWEATSRAIRQARLLCESQGVQFLVVFMPIKARVLSQFIEFDNDRDRDNWLPGGLTDAPGDFATAVSEECRKLGCDFIDMTPPLRRAAETDNRRIYFTTIDTHLDVDGNRVVAEQVSQWLRSKHLAPAVDHPGASAHKQH